MDCSVFIESGEGPQSFGEVCPENDWSQLVERATRLARTAEEAQQ
jgi:hypothetical protein